MRPLLLTELQTTSAVQLTAAERDLLRGAIPGLSVTSTPGHTDLYDLRPAGTVGLIRLGDLQVEIRPKLPIDRVLFLLSYALDPAAWRPEETKVADDAHLLEAIVPTFARHVRQVLRRGLLHGYRSVDDTDTTIRGRIRLADQLRDRPGLLLPVELTYDDFTTDILENQLLAAAVERLVRLPLRSAWTRSTLLEFREQFAGATPLRLTPGHPVPEPVWTRLNARYRPAVGIARLILAGAALDASLGGMTADGVLLNMPSVFENFVIAALREALGLGERSFPQGATGRHLKLDEERTVRLKPDLSWWDGNRCVFVGDCKYKWVRTQGLQNADLYQLLAYLTALELDEGLLVYAAGQRRPRTRTVTHAGKRLTVVTLNLAGTPTQVLSEIEELAMRIKNLAAAAINRPAAAAR